MLEVTFVRRRGHRDRVYVSRDDGTSTGWEFPSYGDGLPHDLCHLVVEDGLRLTDGFWGLVDGGVEVGMVDNQPTLMRGGTPLAGTPGAELPGLRRAEAAVAALAGTATTTTAAVGLAGDLDARLPATATPEVVGAIRDRLRRLGEEWRALDDGAAITVTFSAGAT